MKNARITASVFLGPFFALIAKGSLYNDPAAMEDFTNKTSFNIAALGSVLKVDVEYSVYAPGDYPGDDVTSGNAYIYAYQIFNSVQSNVAVDFFSVGILSNSINFVYTDSDYGISGGVDPFAFNFPQSVGYVFIDDALNPGQWSDVLIFSSIHSPTMGFGTVSDGGLCGMGSLATLSVLPEPATIVMIAPALLVLVNKNKKITGTK
jgi:hypothetical protein